jgi:ATP-dependent Clp protease ATP-binding subunit ClpA
VFEGLRSATRTHRNIMELIRRAGEEARQLGSPTLEAEHFLLAMVDGGDFAAAVLSSLGISRERIMEALDRELAMALARADLHIARLKWGESARRAAERSIDESPEEPALRMLLAIAHAKGGIVPRLLRELGLAVEDVERAVALSSTKDPR